MSRTVSSPSRFREPSMFRGRTWRRTQNLSSLNFQSNLFCTFSKNLFSRCNLIFLLLIWNWSVSAAIQKMSGYYGDGTNRVNSFEPAGGARDISACFLGFDFSFSSQHWPSWEGWSESTPWCWRQTHPQRSHCTLTGRGRCSLDR